MPLNLHVGSPRDRVDGPAKVTGEALYAGEFAVPELAHGVIVSGAIARGTITAIDTAAAAAAPGVLHVFTHLNRPRTAWFNSSWRDEVAPPGAPFRPLYDDRIRFSGQPIALVVAESYEAARHAALLVRAQYRAAPHETRLDHRLDQAYVPLEKRQGIPPPPPARGDTRAALAAAAVRIAADYRVPPQHHNPMEPFASTVVWEGDGRLLIHDKSQGVQNSQGFVSSVFGLPKSDVRVVTPFVGGAFGAGLRPQHQLFLAVMAALELRRSVRVVLTRDQMFTLGWRPETINTVELGAGADGTLTAIRHDAVAATSRFEDYQEATVNWSGLLYHCPNVSLGYKITQLDTATPCDMRAPGATTGVFALETAMDELAHATGVDPLELRLRNYAERDQNEGKAFSSKELRAAYRLGAERFGWSRRTSAPRSMREGRELVGYGMATGCWEAMMMRTSATAAFTADGRLEVASAAADIGTGTYTILAQIAADAFGLPMAAVTVLIGDSALPKSPVEGGSWTAASTGAAVQQACHGLREDLFQHARALPDSPLANLDLAQVRFTDGRIEMIADPSRSILLVAALRGAGLDRLSADATAVPGSKQTSHYTHSAIFAEVRVDAELGVVRLTRLVSAIAAGRILNPKTARSQILGGVVFGIGMALREETILDHQLGRFINHSLAEYHLPVNADVPDIEVIFVAEDDPEVSPMGVKGLGEIGLVGTAAAIGNAVFHATGRRIRDLPITLDKLL